MRLARLAPLLAAATLAAGCVAPPQGGDLPPAVVERPDDPPAAATAPAEEREATPPADDEPPPITERAAREAALRLRVTGEALHGAGSGSGFAIDETTVVTNAHVVADGDRVALTTWDGRDVDTVTVADASFRHDLALLAVAEPLPVAPLELADDATAGQEAVVVGFPGGGRVTVETGARVTHVIEGSVYADRLGGASAPEEVLRVSARSVEPGSSGGPVLDTSGRVIGVVFAYETGEGGAALAVPGWTLRDWLAER